jgi:hypothetical protein
MYEAGLSVWEEEHRPHLGLLEMKVIAPSQDPRTTAQITTVLAIAKAQREAQEPRTETATAERLEISRRAHQADRERLAAMQREIGPLRAAARAVVRECIDGGVDNAVLDRLVKIDLVAALGDERVRPTATAGCYECGDKGAITICARHAKEHEIGDDYNGSTPIDLARMADEFLREPLPAAGRAYRTELIDLLATVEAMAMLRERWQRRESPTNCGPVVELKKLREEVTRLRAGLCEALGAWERLDVEKRDWVRIDSLSVACGRGSADCASATEPDKHGPECRCFVCFNKPPGVADSSGGLPSILPADREALDDIFDELAWPLPSKEWFKKYIEACRAGARIEERDRCAFLVAENKDPKTTLDMILRPGSAKDLP